MALTDTALRQAKPKDKAYTLPDSLGLSLYVAPTAIKSWHFRFTWLGKQVRISLGTYPEIGLKEARMRRDEAREEVARGIDPRESRKEKKALLINAQGHTLRRVYEEWLAFRKGSLKPGSLRIISNSMELDWLPAFGNRQMNSITRSEIVGVIRRIEKRGSVTTAVKTRQRLGQIFRYAIATGIVDTNPTLEMHTVTERITLQRHFPFLPFSELPKTISTILSCSAGQQYKSAFMMMVYCTSRPGEVRHAMWKEINFDNATWTIPAGKMKMRRDHVVPLPKQAIELLKTMLPLTGHLEYIFVHRSDPTKPVSTNYANNVIELSGLTGIQSPHGFRHLFSTEMNGRGYNRDWIERQLAHSDTSIIRDTYNHATYIEQRREMMQDWADLITAVV
ncbi:MULTISPECIES: tyrosine-type recombinase/integrase [Pseudomonas syringae group]|uniref:tyrosine-type recombinase/integrase n=1 Tax=Pseudomonas syringae group TaxID=136849 RepID=UPI00020982B0|nr:MULTISPECIES: tyrosine-type recombinase/integrase [Pseudomonas syringae group]EGH97348.1 site-specific recombinase, phage integrase family protein [Pseudomonas amygdali pv. lachrymans str. M302278]KPC10191.1 Site-specific recombinase [Pseudomonas amygdali pv. lachrymans]RMN50441.1 Site-specific recombinase, phage integrase protein [Pseudomonas syringae pv. apii]SDY77132.1 Integrase [Pseudomonas syringae]